MVDYNIVKSCRRCRKRYVVNKKDSKKKYCTGCLKKIKKEQKEQSGE